MFHKQQPPAGSRPGTLAIPPDSPPPRVYVTQYVAAESRQTEIQEIAELRTFLEGDGVVWVDVQGLGDETRLREIADFFELHPLALEDAVNVPQRAKSQVHPNEQVIVARLPEMGEDGLKGVPQVCFILGRNYLLTFQERYFGFFDPVRQRIREGIGPIRTLGPDYLLYALIDTLVDRYYPIVENLSQQLDELEEEITEDTHPDTLAKIHRIRRQLVVIRRIGWPQREALNTVLRDRTPFIDDEVRRYLRDTFEHMCQIIELVDSCRDMAGGLTEIYLSNVSQKTNDVMKVLTLMASIFIPLTFIAGIYGMNFEFMPELKSKTAYPMVLGSMVALAVGMITFFWYRGWIGSRRRKRR